MKQLYMWSTVLVIFVIISVLWNPNQAEGDPITDAGAFKFNKGTVAPGFNLKDLAGNPVKLEDFRGKVVLLDFWATW